MGYFRKFAVKPGSKVKLKDMDPGFDDGLTREEAEKAFGKNIVKLQALQELLYAEHKRALLVCLQAIDGGGKDGIIRHVFGPLNPQGCTVASFKQPSAR